jgi:hypothetical protein
LAVIFASDIREVSPRKGQFVGKPVKITDPGYFSAIQLTDVIILVILNCAGFPRADFIWHLVCYLAQSLAANLTLVSNMSSLITDLLATVVVPDGGQSGLLLGLGILSLGLMARFLKDRKK